MFQRAPMGETWVLVASQVSHRDSFNKLAVIACAVVRSNFLGLRVILGWVLMIYFWMLARLKLIGIVFGSRVS